MVRKLCSSKLVATELVVIIHEVSCIFAWWGDNFLVVASFVWMLGCGVHLS